MFFLLHDIEVEQSQEVVENGQKSEDNRGAPLITRGLYPRGNGSIIVIKVTEMRKVY